MFEQEVKALVGRSVRLPTRNEDHPDRNRSPVRTVLRDAIEISGRA